MFRMTTQKTTRAAYDIQSLALNTKIKGNVVNIAIDHALFEEELWVSVVHVSRIIL